jgi:hypothetical protein
VVFDDQNFLIVADYPFSEDAYFVSYTFLLPVTPHNLGAIHTYHGATDSIKS